MTKSDQKVVNLLDLMGVLALYHMHGTFALLLALARSTRHLEELHEALPDNQRLLRREFIKLRECWQALGMESGGDKIAPHWADKLIFTAQYDYPRANLTRYYRDVLDQEREQVSREELGVYGVNCTRILSCQERSGHGAQHFMIRLVDHWFTVECYFKNDKFFIRLVTFSNELTEPLTHKLMEIPAIRNSKIATGDSHGRIFSGDGSEVDFYYIAEAAEFMGSGALGEIDTRTNDCVANGRVFLAELAKVLRGFELPFQQVLAIVPWDDETCVPGTHFERGAQAAPNRFWGGTSWQQ